MSYGRSRPLGRELYIAVALVACAVLALEISLSRILSVLLRFHFVFLVISAALCGLGIGGMLSPSSWRRLGDRFGDRWVLGLLALGAAVATPAALALLFRTALSQRLFEALTVPIVSVAPFLFAGAFLSYAFHRAVRDAGALYFADLFGAAVGALAVILLLNTLGGINAAVAASLLFAAAALALFAPGARAGTVLSLSLIHI